MSAAAARLNGGARVLGTAKALVWSHPRLGGAWRWQAYSTYRDKQRLGDVTRQHLREDGRALRATAVP